MTPSQPISIAARPYADAFKGTAKYYAKYRPGYPPSLIKCLADKFNFDGAGRYLDLACGTGKLTFPLARYFDEVLAIDPEQEMLDEAARLARKQKIHNVHFLCASSYDLPELKSILGRLRFVTIGTAFHWMDRAETLRLLHELIEPDGGMAVVTMREYHSQNSLWHEVLQPLIQEWLGKKQRAGSAVYEHSGIPHKDIIKASPFSRHEQQFYMMVREYTADQVVGYLAATSFCSPYVLGDKWNSFEQELRNVLSSLNNGSKGRFPIVKVVESILMWP